MQVIGDNDYQANLHSTVVLLKAGLNQTHPGTVGTFTFYCSSIKSNSRFYNHVGVYIFTFYCSSIKRERKRRGNRHWGWFTFYCSSIKSLSTCLYPCASHSDLHSTVVLLKGNLGAFPQLTVTNLHSTVVLLKAAYSSISISCFFSFTFYCSSIKSRRLWKEQIPLWCIYILL